MLSMEDLFHTWWLSFSSCENHYVRYCHEGIEKLCTSLHFFARGWFCLQMIRVKIIPPTTVSYEFKQTIAGLDERGKGVLVKSLHILWHLDRTIRILGGIRRCGPIKRLVCQSLDSPNTNNHPKDWNINNISY